MVSLTAQQKKDLMMSPAIKKLKKEYDAKIGGKGRMRMKGMGFWDNLVKAMGAQGLNYISNVNKTIKAGTKKAQEIDAYLKKTKVISKVSDFIKKGAEGVETVAGIATALQPELAEITVPILAGAEAAKDVSGVINEGSKKIGYGRTKMKMGGKGINRPLTVRPKGTSVKVLKPPPPTLTIRRDGVFEKTAYPTHVSVQPVKMKGKGVRPGTFNTVYSEYGKTKGL